MLTLISNLSEKHERLAENFINWGVLPKIECQDGPMIHMGQFLRLNKISSSSKSQKNQTLQLFSSESELPLSYDTALFRTTSNEKPIAGAEVLLQLLPYIVEKNGHNGNIGQLGGVDIQGLDLRVLSRNDSILSALEAQQQRFSVTVDRKTALFSRSASYMGSKTTLTATLMEIIDAFFPADGIILDLMCGSGASAGAFSRTRKVYASDAQAFSQQLALVQGGGMTVAIARELSEQIANSARHHFSLLSDEIINHIDIEERYLTTELSEDDKSDFIEWVKTYPVVNSPAFNANPNFSAELIKRRKNPFKYSGLLFTRYYANLFFGVRQAAEIDGLRQAIEEITDPLQYRWALGALICAVSACADTYGGHFAQPKFDISHPDRITTALKDTLLKRSLSVTHEFAVRLINLAHESESILNSVEILPGPWLNALKEMKEKAGKKRVLVYLDPPYTRDEYSRYYHVLETLVAYNYPEVTGKSLAPTKGSIGRFASEFSTRNSGSIEDVICKIIAICIENQWECLWSYSSGGVARVEKIIEECSKFSDFELFELKYSYKAQGKQRSKHVSEYVILFHKKFRLQD